MRISDWSSDVCSSDLVLESCSDGAQEARELPLLLPPLSGVPGESLPTDDFLDVLRDRSEISHVARHGGRGHADRAAGAQHAEQAWKEVIVRAEVLPGVDAHDEAAEDILEGERPGLRVQRVAQIGQAARR